MQNIKWKRWYYLIFLLFAFTGVFNSFIANNKPVLAKTDKGIVSPAFQDFLMDFGMASTNIYQNENIKYFWSINPPIGYKATQPDVTNPGYKAPSGNHIMGTDLIGRDVFAGIIRGCYTSFRIGLFGTLICGFLGIVLGISSGYFENDGIKLNIIQFVLVILLFFIALFYLIYPLNFKWFNGIFWFFMVLIVGYFIIKTFYHHSFKKFKFPLDNIVNKVIEIRKSIPSLIFILACLPLFAKPSINNVILLIALLGWTNFARHSRAETMSLKQREYVQASKIMGGDFLHIMKRHIFPNLAPTLLTLAIGSFTSNILLESTISFLGFGLPSTEVSWGTMIAESRKNIHAWWLFFFPGLTLIILIFSLNFYSTKYITEKG